MAFGEVPKPQDRISALPGGSRESLGLGEGEPGRGHRHLRRAEAQSRSHVWWRPLLTFIEHVLWAGNGLKAQTELYPLILQQPYEKTSKGRMELKSVHPWVYPETLGGPAAW